MLFARFKYWFVNVFWYHYKIHTAAALFALVLIGTSVHSFATRHTPDFLFVLMSDEPVFQAQGEALAGMFGEETGADAVCTVLHMSGASEMSVYNHQLFAISLIDEQYALFIVGESALPLFPELADGFAAMSGLGLPHAVLPELAPLEGSLFMREILLDQEPMYALLKRPGREGGSERFDKAAACLRALLGL